MTDRSKEKGPQNISAAPCSFVSVKIRSIRGREVLVSPPAAAPAAVASTATASTMTSAAATSAATAPTTRTPAAATIPASVSAPRTISTAPSTHGRWTIAVEVRLRVRLIGKIPAALNYQRTSHRRFSIARRRCRSNRRRFPATHLRALFLQNRLSR